MVLRLHTLFVALTFWVFPSSLHLMQEDLGRLRDQHMSLPNCKNADWTPKLLRMCRAQSCQHDW